MSAPLDLRALSWPQLAVAVATGTLPREAMQAELERRQALLRAQSAAAARRPLDARQRAAGEREEGDG